jgi:hypothetical protein
MVHGLLYFVGHHGLTRRADLPRPTPIDGVMRMVYSPHTKNARVYADAAFRRSRRRRNSDFSRRLAIAFVTC